MLTRRQLLQSGGAAGAAIVLARAPFTWAAGNAPLPKFADALPTPGTVWGVLDLRQEATAAQSASLTVCQFAAHVHSSLPRTAVWGYGSESSSTYLGPTIVVRSGHPVDVTVRNRLPSQALLAQDPAVVPDVANAAANRINTHLHGAHVETASDGNPYYVFDPPAGATKNAYEPVPGPDGDPAAEQTMTYANDQAAATLFYHDHAIGITRTNAYLPGIALNPGC